MKVVIVMSKLKRIVGIMILVAGIVLLFYPTVCNLIQQYNNANLIQEYENSVNSMSDDDMNSTMRTIENYNNNIKDNKVQDVDYNSDMFIDGFMGYIDIPKSNIYLPIYKGTSDFVLENGIGHVKDTSLPYGGNGTHCVLTGHTGLAENRLFTDIDKLGIGDMFYIHILGEVHAYEVNNISVVLPTEIKSFDIDENEDYVTLMTCTPYGVNSHRLLVQGNRVEYSGEAVVDTDSSEAETKQKQLPTNVDDRKNDYTKILIFFAVALVVILALIFVIVRITKHKRRLMSDGK